MNFIQIRKTFLALIVGTSLSCSHFPKEADNSKGVAQLGEPPANEASKSDGGSDSKSRLLEEAFKADDGCRELYYRIKEDMSVEALHKNIEEADQHVTYQRVMKNPEPFYGTPVAFSARVKQIWEIAMKDGTFTEALVYWRGSVVSVSLPTATPLLEGDRAFVVGYLAKHRYEYKSIAQWDMAVPLVIGRAMLRSKPKRK